MGLARTARTESPTLRDQAERDALVLALADAILWLVEEDEGIAHGAVDVAAERRDLSRRAAGKTTAKGATR